MGHARIEIVNRIAKLAPGQYINVGPYEHAVYERLAKAIAARKSRGTMSSKFYFIRNEDNEMIAGRLPHRSNYGSG